MNIDNSYIISALVFLIIISIVYYSKKRINSVENHIYSGLIITTIIGSFIAIPTYYFVKNYSDNIGFLTELIPKLYLIYLVTWTFFITLYLIVLTEKSVEKHHKIYTKAMKILPFYIILNMIIILILPIKYYSENGVIYTYGASVNLTYIICGIHILFWIFEFIYNFKLLKTKKSIPMISAFVFGFMMAIVQKIDPSIRLLTPILSLIVIIMYFTIENPDVKMIKALNEAKDRAERANSAKSDFLSSMSHEIRTPLNAIVGFSNGLIENDKLDDNSKEDVKNIIMASGSLLELVNGILDISKIEAGKLEIIDNYYNFNKTFDELVLLTKARIGEKPLEFRYKYDKSIPEYLYGDVTRVKQVILNLLTNSVKYTNDGFVEFRVNNIIKGDVVRLIISVEDSGIGIKRENIDKLFGKFERLGVEKDTTVEGTGLGLAITKKLVEMMGGKIVVQSVYGKGSIFTITIDQKMVSEEEIKRLKSEEVVTTVNEKIDVSDKKVLVVDDNNLNLKVAERLLETYKCKIECVNSGFQCIENIAAGKKYDLILLDDMMPKMSGCETLVKLKEIESFNTPVVALTANAISGMREEYLKKGFDDYLSKPIEKEELNRVIKKYLC